MAEARTLTSSAAAFSMLNAAAVRAGIGRINAGLVLQFDAANHARIEHDRVSRFFSGMAEDERKHTLGLRLASQAPLRAYNAVMYAFLSSPSLHAGLEALVRYQEIHTLASKLEILRGLRGDILRVKLADGAVPTTRTQVEYCLGLVWRYIQWQTGNTISPAEVRLRRPRLPDEPYSSFFSCTVLFDQDDDAILLDEGACAARSLHDCPEILRSATCAADEQLARLETDNITLRTQIVLRKLTDSSSNVTIDEAARRLNMSSRTLQRRLAESGTTFTQVVDQFRAELARHLLSQTTAPIKQISSRCGFADQRAFNRAFRRWADLSPVHFRKRSKMLLQREGATPEEMLDPSGSSSGEIRLPSATTRFVG
ncbi:helix-turn-helix domain-containing protein [Consotaella aegiceratis]|uniref:helix-turn-helix domain-containing protein n=1 Tax=Consotaella aegiceratis TaxID=3097961 RepID=UPI002F4006D4